MANNGVDVLLNIGNQIELDDHVEEAILDHPGLVFRQHKGAVLCCSLEPTQGRLAVSGGHDGKAYLWNATNGEVVLECEKFNDSVTCVSFNHDGTFLAIGDISGLIRVLNVSTMQRIWNFTPGDLNWLEWHPDNKKLFGGMVNGDTRMWEIPYGNSKVYQGPGVSNECGKLVDNGKQIAVAYFDGSIALFDIDSRQAVRRVNSHVGSVLALDARKDSIVTGSTDCTAKLYNAETLDVIMTECPEGYGQDNYQPPPWFCKMHPEETEYVKEESNVVECAIFCPDLKQSIVVFGTLGGEIVVWDYVTEETDKLDHKVGITKLAWHPTKRDILFSGGFDGAIRMINIVKKRIVRAYFGHAKRITDLAISSDGRRILTSSIDQTCRVLEMDAGMAG